MDEQPEVAVTRVPGPRRGRSSALFRVFRSLLVSFLVAVLIIAVGIYYAGREFDRPGPLTGVGAVVVERGMNAEDIANRLKEHGVVAHAYGFIVAAAYARLHGWSLKAGEYEFPAGASLRQVLSMITEGKALIYRVTVSEGMTTTQILERIAASGALVEAAPENLPEGVLLPDTYTYTRGTTRTELVQRMQEAQQQLLDELWDGRAKDLPLKTKQDAVILASIVEKETSRPAERGRVAAVFLNRLKRSMRLQSDPTIIYGLVGGKGRLERPISRDDISQKTAYNTYRINGLPPTPIANPGREAIRAVLNPATTEDIYFVADGSRRARLLQDAVRAFREGQGVAQVRGGPPHSGGGIGSGGSRGNDGGDGSGGNGGGRSGGGGRRAQGYFRQGRGGAGNRRDGRSGWPGQGGGWREPRRGDDRQGVSR